MAQLRREYDKFTAINSELLVIGPEDAHAFQSYWAEHHLPYPGLPDPQHTVLKRYGQEVKIFKFGRMPAQVIVDKAGIARYIHYGHSMQDIPKNEDLLLLLTTL